MPLRNVQNKTRFANHCLDRELNEIPFCFIFFDVWELFYVSTIPYFSAIVQTACNITYTVDKPVATLFVSSENVFFPLLLHEQATTVKFVDLRLYILYIVFCTAFKSLFAQKDIFYSAVAHYKVKRRDCYCTPCFVCKRETFDQFHTR